MITGTEGPDSLTGTSAADSIYAAGGNDTVHAGLGDDSVDGGTGSDLIYGEGGNDILYGGQDTVADTLMGGDGSDTILGGPGADSIDAGTGDDAVGIDNGNRVLGGAGDDYLQINESSSGVFGHTYIDGGTETDWVDFTYYQNPAEVWIDQVSATGFELHNIELVTMGAAGGTVHGGAGDDLILAANGAVSVTGGAGDDAIAGFDPNDTIDGGDGDDIISGGFGSNTLSGGLGRDLIDYSWLDFRGVQIDLRSTGSQDNGYFFDTLSGFEDLVGTNHGDIITGSVVSNLIQGMAGDDTLYGTAGQDTFDGGDGYDTLSFSILHAPVTVDMAAHTVTFAGGVTTLVDVEAVEGTEGNDVFLASDGDDVMYGLNGKDTVSYASASAGVSIDLSLQGQAQDTGGSGTDLLGIFDVLIGSAFDDTLTGWGRDETLQGGGGDDILVISDGKDRLDGGDGFDTVRFVADASSGLTVDFAKGVVGWANGDTQISSVEWIESVGDVNDYAYASAGNDGMDAGDGRDTLSFERSRAGITYSLASDKAQDTGGSGIDRFVSFELVYGSKFADVLTNEDNGGVFAGAGNDTLIGAKKGSDTMFGGDGDDTLIGGHGSDTFYGDAGRDTASFAGAKAGITLTMQFGGATATGDGTDVLISIQDVIGGAGADHITGDEQDNHFSGGAGADVLVGGDGDDVLEGGAGNDKLTGGEGSDTLTGGAGSDTFIFLDIDESWALTTDLITDLDKKDVIDLSKIDADVTHAGDQAFVLVKHFTGHAGEAMLTYDAGTGITSLSLDVDGQDAQGDMVVRIEGNAVHFTGFVL